MGSRRAARLESVSLLVGQSVGLAKAESKGQLCQSIASRHLLRIALEDRSVTFPHLQCG